MSNFVRSCAHLSGGRIWRTEEGYPKYIQTKNMMIQLIQDIILILQPNNKDKPRKWNEPGYRNYIFNTYTLYSVTRCIFWHYSLLIWKGAQMSESQKARKFYPSTRLKIVSVISAVKRQHIGSKSLLHLYLFFHQQVPLLALLN